MQKELEVIIGFRLSIYRSSQVFVSSPVRSFCYTPDIVYRLSSVLHRVSSVSTITTRNNKDIKSIFSANVYVPELVAPPTLVIKL